MEDSWIRVDDVGVMRNESAGAREIGEHFFDDDSGGAVRR
jgi:hypothetical protein